MENISRFSSMLRILMNALAIIITSLAFALLENSFIEQLKNNIVFQLLLLSVFLVIFVFSIIEFRRDKGIRLGDLISIGLCVPIILLTTISTINTSDVGTKEKALLERVVRIHTIGYSVPGSFRPKVEYYQAFLLNSNYILVSTDVLYSDTQVYFGERKLWPCENFNAINGSFSIAYFDDPIQISEVDILAIPQAYQIDGTVRAYLFPENDVVRDYKCSIQGKILSEDALLPIDMNIIDIPLSPEKNIIPISSNGRLVGFLQSNSSNYNGIRLHSSIGHGIVTSTIMDETLEYPLTSARYKEGYLNQDGQKTVTTFVLSPFTHPEVRLKNGFTRSEVLRTYINPDFIILYEYVHVWYLNEDSIIPISGDAAEYYYNLQYLQYSDAPQTNEEGKELDSFSQWISNRLLSFVPLDNVETNIYRRKLDGTGKTEIRCDQGEYRVNYYDYDEWHRTAVYK